MTATLIRLEDATGNWLWEDGVSLAWANWDDNATYLAWRDKRARRVYCNNRALTAYRSNRAFADYRNKRGIRRSF